MKKNSKPAVPNLIKSKKGMTLVEIIVAFAIIALSALILVSAIGAAGNIMRRGADLETASNAAYEGAETATAGDSGAVSFSANGQTITVNGKYIKDEQDVNDVTKEYNYFEPNK